MKTTNPFKHPFPHAKLSVKPTDIRRLSKPPEHQRFPMVGYRTSGVSYRSQADREIYEQMMREKAERDRTG